MSTKALRQRAATETTSEPNPLQCLATNCPMLAGLMPGNGRPVCRYHAGAEAHKWPAITAALHENAGLIGVIAQARIAYRTGEPHIPLVDRAMHEHPELLPSPRERYHFPLWFERMERELMWRVGLLSKRPYPRDQQPKHTAHGHGHGHEPAQAYDEAEGGA